MKVDFSTCYRSSKGWVVADFRTLVGPTPNPNGTFRLHYNSAEHEELRRDIFLTQKEAEEEFIKRHQRNTSEQNTKLSGDKAD